MPNKGKRSGPGRCVLCNQNYADLLEHFKKSHSGHSFRPSDLSGTGLLVCHCGKPAKNARGLSHHQLKSRCGENGGKTRLLTGLELLGTTRAHSDAPSAFPATLHPPTPLPRLQSNLACPTTFRQPPQPRNSTLEARTVPRMPPTPPAPILHPTALPTGSQSADSGPIHCPQPLHPLDWRMKEETK